ncbi:PAS domain-containing hybrid sensor histidine kinase/response regulator [Paractinoplanes ferrugineus]|uniref:histidine kinase n=1 Tax=Paractinoplanes ferrugineus TaxID=113564 RepID=A0A919IZW6_9ACTN|nr:PAS domain S-box protein [Actinoplanes ferrugineus]GIE11303.1 histidine kinase [Actinoplanes ferrugineus]
MGETHDYSGPGQGELLRAMVRTAHDAIFAVGRDFTVLFWNPAAETLFGYRAEEIVGRSVDLLVPPDRQADQREMLLLMESGARLERFRSRRRHRDGHWLQVTLTMSPLFDGDDLIGYTVIARSVSHRERLESSFQALLEAAPDAFVGVGDDGRVVLANSQADTLFGLTRHGLIGREIDKLLVPPLPREIAPAIEEAHDPGSHARRADGTTVPVEVSVSILPTDDGRIRCAVIRDITERVRATERFRALQAEADRARTEAERAQTEAQLQRAQRLEGLGQLAGGVAHDFNNLIAVISNYATFIAEAAADHGLAEIAGDAGQITKAAQRGADLTHQLLAFARREVVRPRPLSLNEIVTDIEQILRRSIGEHITLDVHLAPDLPSVTADPGQLDQVLVNLAVNARDAMPRGGTITIETSELVVDRDYAAARPALRTGHYVRLRFSDTGTGMPAEVIERAFEPFYTTKPAGKGTGLGLATVFGIITAAGGDLSIYSEPGAGTTFIVLLPTTDAEPVEVVEPVEADPTDFRRGTVLAVEDEAALRDVLRRILAGAGHEALIAADGPAALALATDYPGHIDVLLTDVVMPHMLGKDLAERFLARRPDAGVLFMSGYARPALASQGTLDPDVTLVEKPFSKTQLLAAVRHCLDRS